MSTTFQELYSGVTDYLGGTHITMISLAAGTYNSGDAIDNSTNLYTDYRIVGQVKTGASGLSGTGQFQIFIADTVDGTLFTHGILGTGKVTGVSPDNVNNWQPVCTIVTPTAATVYTFDFWLVAALQWDHCPQKFVPVIRNTDTAALDGTVGNFAFKYYGVNFKGV